HWTCALKHGSLPYMSFQPQPLSWTESKARFAALVTPCGAAPAAKDVPLQPLPFMSKPQLPAGGDTAAEARGCARPATPAGAGAAPVSARQGPAHSCRCATGPVAGVVGEGRACEGMVSWASAGVEADTTMVAMIVDASVIRSFPGMSSAFRV